MLMSSLSDLFLLRNMEDQCSTVISEQREESILCLSYKNYRICFVPHTNRIKVSKCRTSQFPVNSKYEHTQPP